MARSSICEGEIMWLGQVLGDEVALTRSNIDEDETIMIDFRVENIFILMLQDSAYNDVALFKVHLVMMCPWFKVQLVMM